VSRDWWWSGLKNLTDEHPAMINSNNKGAEVDVSKIVNKDTGLVFFLYPKVSGLSGQ
jgi:hypothetical protein